MILLYKIFIGRNKEQDVPDERGGVNISGKREQAGNVREKHRDRSRNKHRPHIRPRQGHSASGAFSRGDGQDDRQIPQGRIRGAGNAGPHA